MKFENTSEVSRVNNVYLGGGETTLTNMRTKNRYCKKTIDQYLS